MNTVKRTFLCLAALMVFGCNTSQTDTDQAIIATSIFPVYDWTRELLGSKDQIINILPAGANPHHFEPTPGVLKKLQHIRLFIGMDPHFDGWAETLLPDQAERIYLGRIFQNEDEKRNAVRNPHHWLSVRRTKRMVSELSFILCSTFPERQKTIKTRTLSYINQLDELDQTIQQLFSGMEGNSFVQWHPAWDYFAKDYGLKISGTLTYGHGDTPSIKKLKLMIDQAKRDHISVVVQDLNEQPQIALMFAKETNVPLLKLDTLGDPDSTERSSYILFMKYNARLLASGLNH